VQVREAVIPISIPLLTPGDWNRPTYGIKVCIKESWCAVSRVAYRFEEAYLGMFAMKLVTK